MVDVNLAQEVNHSMAVCIIDNVATKVDLGDHKMNLSKVSWISLRNVTKLNQVGVHTTKDLLHVGRDSEHRAVLAKKVGVTRRKVLGWVCSADLTRINGIGDDYVTILTRSNVQTPHDLVDKDVDCLLEQIAVTNSTYRLVRRMPASTSVSNWIKSARTLPVVVSYEQ